MTTGLSRQASSMQEKVLTRLASALTFWENKFTPCLAEELTMLMSAQ